jgi:hypothetical protein
VLGVASENATSAIGSTIRLDDQPCQVIGVMPQGFVFRDDRVRVWTALPVEDTPNNRERHGMFAHQLLIYLSLYVERGYPSRYLDQNNFL